MSCCFDRHCAAVQVYEEMQACNIEPTAVTFGCLLAACHQLANADRAFELYRQSSARGLKDDGAVLDLLIQVCASTQR